MKEHGRAHVPSLQQRFDQSETAILGNIAYTKPDHAITPPDAITSSPGQTALDQTSSELSLPPRPYRNTLLTQSRAWRVGIAATAAYALALIHSGEQHPVTAAEPAPTPGTPVPSLLFTPEASTLTLTPTPRQSPSAIQESTTPTRSPSPSPSETPTPSPSRTPTSEPTASRTPTRLGSPTAEVASASGILGGRGFTRGQGEQMWWTDGTIEAGYRVLRLTGNGLTMDTLGPDTATYTGSKTTNDGLHCDLLVPIDQNGNPLGTSDLLCALPDTKSATGAPEQFTVSLNESQIATLQFDPTGPGYKLFVLDATGLRQIDLPAGSTITTVDTNKKPAMFAIMKPSGELSEILATFYGYSSNVGVSGSSQGTITPIPTDTPDTRTATPQQTSTRTASPTATRSATPTPRPSLTFTRTPDTSPTVTRTPEGQAYYTQIIDTMGFKIESNANANPQNMQEAKAAVDRMIQYNSTFRDKIVQVGSRLALIPSNGKLTDLPEFASYRGIQLPNGSMFDDIGIIFTVYNGYPLAVVKEEYAQTYKGAIYQEVASAFSYVWTPEQNSSWNTIYQNAKNRGVYSGTYGMQIAQEYWKELSRSYLSNVIDEYGGPAGIQANDPDAYARLTSTYGPPPTAIEFPYNGKSQNVILAYGAIYPTP